MTGDDQNILDIIQAVTRDLRHSASFRELLHPLDDDTARRVAERYIQFLYQVLEIDRPGGGENNNRR